MIGTFKLDKSFIGHTLEAQLIAAVMGVALWNFGGFQPWPAYLWGGALAVAYYIGREKRDCETGLTLPTGSPKAWILMWVRWNNLLDVLGPILAYGGAWAVYSLQGASP